MEWQSFRTQHRGTKRTMGLLYLILSLLLNDEVHSLFEVTKYPYPFSWQEALHSCDNIRRNLTFAVPVVNLSTMAVLDKIDLQEDAWVGYFKTYEYFRFIVCVPLREIESSVSATFNVGRRHNQPGLCYSLCGLQGYIGLQDNLCYCIEPRTFSTPDIHSVNSSCEDPLHCAKTGMLCGNLRHIKISVYKNVFISPNLIRGIGSGCLIVTKKKREYEMNVTNCSGSFRHLCESYTGQTLHLEESPTKDQWVYSIRHCGKTGKKPTTFIGNVTNFVFPNSSQSWWTSVVRDLVIQNCSESMTIKGTPLYEGFLTKSNEGIKLDFVSAWKNSKKTFVACMSDESLGRSAASPQFTDKPFPGCNSEPTGVNITYGMVAVSVTLLVALVITALVCIFRRRQAPQESVKLSATRSTREQHVLLERQITNPPSKPSRQIHSMNDNLQSSYLTVIFDQGRQDVAIEQPGYSHFD